MSLIRCPFCQSVHVQQTDTGNPNFNYFEQLQRCISPTQMAMFGMQVAKKAGVSPFIGVAIGVVIGGVLVPGASAPKLLTRAMLKQMKAGSVVVDVAIDQGGCFETSHATTHDEPTYLVDGVIHYCVANMPGAVPRTSTFALNNATLPYALAFVGALAWSVYAVFTPAMSHGVDGTSLFFPCVAVALWIIHFASGQGWPAEPPSLVAWLFVLIAAAAIGGGYACWGYGILHGSMERLAIASYATPVLSTGASAVLLGLALSLPFWCGALLVAVGSVLNYLVSARK